MNDNTIDTFDRLLGALHDLPDVSKTQPSTIQTIMPVIGATETFIVQTVRQKDRGDTIFLQRASKDGLTRIATPAQVADAIARQRDALTGKSRSRAAKANAAARKAAGIAPGFMKGKKAK